MDMLVKLYDLPDEVLSFRVKRLADRGIRIKRAMPPDMHRIVHYVREGFSNGWASECEVCFSRSPVSCFVAVDDDVLVGFACYETTARGFFGPIGVSEDHRTLGIGAALVLKCLASMRELGYGYAIIGGVKGAEGFYEKVAAAMPIRDSFPGVYKDMIGIERVRK